MSTKRKDNKNRLLRNGESQRQDGRYAYKYYDKTVAPILSIVGNSNLRIRFQQENEMTCFYVRKKS